MSTITREFTKEQLIEKLEHRISVASGFPGSEKAQMDLELARIALESLEAEPVGYFGRFDADDEDLIDQCSPNIIGAFPLYAAPPAPANAEPVAWLWSNRKHPSEVTLVRPEDDEKAEGAHWSGWSCQALYAEPSAPVSVPDERYLHLSELYHAQEKRLFKLAQRIKGSAFDKYAHSPSQAIDVLESALFGESDDTCRAAMLQGAEPVTTAYKLPFEQWLSQQTGTIDVECGCVMTEVFFHWLRVAYEAANSSVIPDGVCPCCGRKPLKNRTCSVSGCDGKHVARGFCIKHYAIERKKDPSRRESIRAADKRYRARKAAAPQQEISHALAKGMERYGDAMQELAKKEVK